MAKPFARSFYSSRIWQTCRDNYAAKRGWLCERCLKRGVLSYGEIVHHKIELTPDNINDPGVTLNFNNLELLCRQCHAEAHGNRLKHRRFIIGSDGEIIIETPPGSKDESAQL